MKKSMRQNHFLLLIMMILATSLLWVLIHPQCSGANLDASPNDYNLDPGEIRNANVDPGIPPEKAPLEAPEDNNVVMEGGLREASGNAGHTFAEEQARRAEVLRGACTKGASRASYDSALRNVVADEKLSLLFCPIYKAASSSWLVAMLEMRGLWSPAYTSEHLNRIRKDVYKPLTGITPREQESTYGTRFLVVRHPFERLLSCYRDKYEEASKPYYFITYGKAMMLHFREVNRNYSATQITNLLAKAEQDPERERILGNPFANPVGPTFTEFVRYVVSRLPDDEHWRPYHMHCAPCSLHYNYILRFENLATEGDYFLQYLQAKPNLRQRRENVFSGPPTTDVVCSYYSQLDKTLLDELVTKYYPDFDLFEYSPEAYLNCTDEYVKQ